MFFGLQAINDHPCCRMQSVVEAFFRNSVDQRRFSLNLFPEWFRATLRDRRSTLDKEFKKVHRLLHAVVMDERRRRQIYEQVESINHIQELCDGRRPIPADVIDWDSKLGKSINSLMDRLYNSLDLAIFRRGEAAVEPTQQLYSEFIRVNKYVCPFCGIGKYRNELGPRREDFDHYLHKSGYPLAAANMRNIVPACSICNQDFKKAKNILADGSAFYPYADIPEMRIQVTCDNFPTPAPNDRGDWSVNIELVVPDPTTTPKLETWDRVYEIKKRLRDEVKVFCEEWMLEVTEKSTEVMDAEAFEGLISSERDEARSAILRKMKPGELIRSAFYEFALANINHPFFESFRRARNAVFI